MVFESAKGLLSKTCKGLVSVFKMNPNLIVKGLIYLIEFLRD